MFTYRIEDMTCGHCAGTITRAIHAVDAGANVEIDLPGHLVRVVPSQAGAQAVTEAIAAAGYAPFRVEDKAPQAPAPSAPRTGCGCGC